MSRPRGTRGRFVSRAALSAGYSPENPRTCAVCGTTRTSQWRSAPDGRSLCNADGIRAARADRAGRTSRAERTERFGRSLDGQSRIYSSYNYGHQGHTERWHDDKLWAETRIASSRRRQASYRNGKSAIYGGIAKPHRSLPGNLDSCARHALSDESHVSVYHANSYYTTPSPSNDRVSYANDLVEFEGMCSRGTQMEGTRPVVLPALRPLYKPSALANSMMISNWQNSVGELGDGRTRNLSSHMYSQPLMSPVTYSSSIAVQPTRPDIHRMCDSGENKMFSAVDKQIPECGDPQNVKVGILAPRPCVAALLSSQPSSPCLETPKYPSCLSPTLSSTTLPPSPSYTRNHSSRDVCSLQNILN